MATQNIKASALAYLTEYPEGDHSSIPTPGYTGIVVTAVEKKLCAYMTTLDLKNIKSAVLKDARLEATFLLIGLQVGSYKQLWMHQLKALETWADTASGAQVKGALRDAGWLPKPTEIALARCIGRDGVSNLTRTRIIERFS